MVAEETPGEIYYEEAPQLYTDGVVQPMPAPGSPSCSDCGTPGAACGVESWGPFDSYGGGWVPWWGFVPGRLWVQGEGLLWWTKRTDLPPLVTTSPSGTAQAEAGRLGEDTTAILFGNESVNNRSRGGFRIAFGLRPAPCAPWGIETSYIGLDEQSTFFSATSSEDMPILARPFFNIGTNPAQADALLIAFPNVRTGSVDAELATSFQGVEVLLRRRLSDWCSANLDFITGWRYVRLDDDLLINSQFRVLSDPVLETGTRVSTTDLFETENKFNGAEVGFTTHWQHCRWSLDLLMKVALGGTQSDVTIAGRTVNRIDGEETPQDVGLLARSSNIGAYRRKEFAMLPEIGFTIGYDWTCRLRATFGYTLIYWGQVARAADQIDLDLNLPPVGAENPSTLPRPQFPFATDDFWAQGMNFGLEYRF